jgi:hypothetical protein
VSKGLPSRRDDRRAGEVLASEGEAPRGEVDIAEHISGGEDVSLRTISRCSTTRLRAQRSRRSVVVDDQGIAVFTQKVMIQPRSSRRHRQGVAQQGETAERRMLREFGSVGKVRRSPDRPGPEAFEEIRQVLAFGPNGVLLGPLWSPAVILRLGVVVLRCWAVTAAVLCHCVARGERQDARLGE